MQNVPGLSQTLALQKPDVTFISRQLAPDFLLKIEQSNVWRCRVVCKWPIFAVRAHTEQIGLAVDELTRPRRRFRRILTRFVAASQNIGGI